LVVKRLLPPSGNVTSTVCLSTSLALPSASRTVHELHAMIQHALLHLQSYILKGLHYVQLQQK